MANWSSLNRIMWALELKGVSPIARLMAVFLADKFRLAEPSEDPWEIGEDPELLAEVGRAGIWIGCQEAAVVEATRELVRHGIRLTDIRDGIVRFRFPMEAPDRAAQPEQPKYERRISVYVISAGTGATKIGISASPPERLHGLQSANPMTRLKLEFSVEDTSSKIRRVEREAHAELGAHAIGNEWFSVTVDEAIRVVKRLMEGE